MNYHDATKFLAEHTDLVELADGDARVAVAPGWQGRVMTSTCGGLGGASFGFINRPFIERGEHDPKLNNYGGEERLWLSPEGGPFSLWFAPGVPQVFDTWYTQPMLNEGAWQVVGRDDAAETSSGGDGTHCRMKAGMTFRNAAGRRFSLDVEREVGLLTAERYASLFGSPAADAMTGPGVRSVGYETRNRITNRGDAMTRPSGLVSIWILGMMNAGRHTVVVMPYRPGAEGELGPVVKSDYFGTVPSERLRAGPEAVMFLADGNCRSKIGASQQRAKNVLGSIDFDAGVLTLVHFSMPDRPAECFYMNNQWGVEQAAPYAGDVVNAYNDGPNESGEQLGTFYEIESLSPAEELSPGEWLEHSHRTIHVEAEPAALDAVARKALGVPLDAVRNAMFP